MDLVYLLLTGVTWVVAALLLLGIYKLRSKKKISASAAYVLGMIVFSIRGTVTMWLIVMFARSLT